NIGYISMNCSNTNTCDDNNYKVSTDWIPKSARPSSGSTGGGWNGSTIVTPPTIPTYSTTVTPANGGTLNYTFTDNSSITVVVPANTVISNTTITVSEGSLSTDNTPNSSTGAFMIGNSIFNISAIDINNSSITSFTNNLTISITLSSIPSDTSNLGVYYYDTTLDSWILVENAVFDTVTNKVVFTVNHLTKFAIFNITGVPDTIDTNDVESSIPQSFWTTGKWVKTEDRSTVYFVDSNNDRHAYPNESIWYSYFDNDFSFVSTITKEELATYTLGKNVPYNTGILFKIPTVAKVYLVGVNGLIQWIKTEEKAIELYGANWNKLVHDLPDEFFGDYTEGEEIE
ncbi:MAG: hypothetical protein PHZ07_03045, partial [Patescibacteria group bacterium]|nr:hypothetical protein [Patescibacteria group bacterium]MDD4304401.1 hypothetical protein [Patescibacteria group bacterium]MDD4695424.1 hypothetical protein [Patescibacteria group bacterium]